MIQHFVQKRHVEKHTRNVLEDRHCLFRRFHLRAEVCLLTHAISIATCSSYMFAPCDCHWCHCLKWQFPSREWSQSCTQQHRHRQATQRADGCAWAVCVMKETKQNSMEKGVWSLSFPCSFTRVLEINLLEGVGICVYKSTLCCCHVCVTIKVWRNSSALVHEASETWCLSCTHIHSAGSILQWFWSNTPLLVSHH